MRRIAVILTDEVIVIRTVPNQETKHIEIYLDRPWNELSAELQGRVLEELDPMLGENRDDEGWAFDFRQEDRAFC